MTTRTATGDNPGVNANARDVERAEPDPPGRAAPWLLAGAVVSVLIAGASAALLLASVHDGVHTRTENWTVDAVIAVTFPALGALIGRYRPRNRLAWLCVGCGLCAALTILAEQYAHWAVDTRGGGLPLESAAAWLSGWIWVPAVVPIPTLLLLMFPDGELAGRRARRLALAAGASMALFAVGLAFLPHHLATVDASFDNPLGWDPAKGVLIGLLAAASALGLISGVGAVGSLISRLLRAEGLLRRQLGAFATGGAILVVDLALNDVLPARTALQAVALACVPAAAGVAIFAFRLYDIDLFVNRALVYAALTACVAGAYLAGVVLFDSVIGRRTALGPLVAAALVAIMFNPLRSRLQRGADRLVYGHRAEPYQAMARLAEQLERAPAPEEALPTILGTITVTLRLPFAAIEIVADDGRVLATVRHGAEGVTTESFPLSHQGQFVGRLVVGHRSGESAFGAKDRRALESLARPAGAAVFSNRLLADLQASRERLVSAREEERRRLRRDLHDGLGPSLAALVAGIDTTLNVITVAGDDRATNLLRGLRAQAQEMVGEVRRLAHDLRPPALDDLGLLGAIQQYVGRLEGAGCTFAVEGPAVAPEWPAAVETAVYRIVLEAVTNVVRHAGASRCEIRLEAGDEVRVEITDNGRGLPDPLKAGVGVRSIAERVAELAGRYRLANRPEGGCRVEASLPLPAPVPSAVPAPVLR